MKYYSYSMYLPAGRRKLFVAYSPSRSFGFCCADDVQAAETSGKTTPAFAMDEELLTHCEITNPSHEV